MLQPGRAIRRSVLLALSLAAVSRSTQAQVQWTLLAPPASPPARAGHAMAYDESRDRMVLFGGLSLGGPLADTWEFDGQTWSRRNPVHSPPVRVWHRMVYDCDRQRVVLFGGLLPQYALADTWEWDGSDWTEVATTRRPPARGAHGMAYDRDRRRVVLFGGDPDLRSTLDDTWEFDGTDWTQRTPANVPSTRAQHGMAYDEARRRTVVFGGASGTMRACSLGTWEWDGNDWTPSAASPQPSERVDLSLAYDAARGRIVSFGGGPCLTNPLRDTWDFDGVRWLQRTAPVTAAPLLVAMAYDRARRRMVLFGGDDGPQPNGDTWALTPEFPSDSEPFGTGCGGSNGIPALTSSLPWLGDALAADLANLPTNPALPASLALGASDRRIGPVVLPLDLAFAGMPGCRLLTSTEVLFAVPNHGGVGRGVIPIPNDAALRGARAFAQGIVPDAAANAGGATVSGGLRLTLGSR